MLDFSARSSVDSASMISALTLEFLLVMTSATYLMAEYSLDQFHVVS
jgi:hypothetical protein